MDATGEPQQLRQDQRDQAVMPPMPAVAPAEQQAVQPAAVQQAGAAAVERMATTDVASTLKPDDVGRLTQPVRAKDSAGKDVTLNAGTIVAITAVEGHKLTVYEQTTGTPVYDVHIDASQFKLEPGMINDPSQNAALEGQGHYGKIHGGNLWDPATGPKPEDARHQGMAGDCYFISSMAAVCAADPAQIESRFNIKPEAGKPTHKHYKVTLWVPDQTQALSDDAPLVEQTVEVDRWLPEANAGNVDNVPTNGLLYDGYNPNEAQDHKGNATPWFWGELLEKAWAQVKGSYDVVGRGGWPARGLEALTGVRSEEAYAGNGDGLDVPAGMDAATYFKQKFTAYQAAGDAVVIGTRSDIGEDPATGPFGFVGSHAYMLERIDGDNLIFRNPWGIDDPQPLPMANVLDVVGDLGANTVTARPAPAPEAAPAVAQTAATKPEDAAQPTA